MDPLVMLGSSSGIVIAFVFLLYVVRKQLEKKKIVFKDDDYWFYIATAAGIPLALLQQAIEGFGTFTVGGFIKSCLFMMAGAAFAYKTYKVTKNGLEKIKKNDDTVIPDAEEETKPSDPTLPPATPPDNSGTMTPGSGG